MIELTVIAAELVLVGTCISSGCLCPAINKWIGTSGLAFLDTSIYKLNVVTLILSLVAVIEVYYYMKKRSQLLAFIIAFPLGILVSFELFFGLTLYVEPITYIRTLYDTWERNSNTLEVETIRKKFSCCSFYNLGHFESINCPNRRICARVIADALNEWISSTGFLLIVHALAHLIVIVTIFYSAGHVQNRNRRMNCRLDDELDIV